MAVVNVHHQREVNELVRGIMLAAQSDASDEWKERLIRGALVQAYDKGREFAAYCDRLASLLPPLNPESQNPQRPA